MIYEALIAEAETTTEPVAIKICEEYTQVTERIGEWTFSYRITEEARELTLVYVVDHSDRVDVNNDKGYYRTEITEFPEDCIKEFSCILMSTGLRHFIWNRTRHRVDITMDVENNNHFYSYEWGKSFGRKVVIKHPKQGMYFELHPNEKEYVAVNNGYISAVMEQAERLGTRAGIPITWLSRTETPDGFKYQPVR